MIFIRLGVVGILLILFFHYVDLGLLLNHLNFRIASNMLVVQPIMLLSNIIVAFRFSVLVKIPPAPFMPCLKATILSVGLSSILPAQMSQMFKISYLRDHAGIPVGSALAGIFLEKVIDLILIGLLALISVGLLFGSKISSAWIFLLLLVLISFVFTIPYLEKPILHFNSRFVWRSVQGLIENFLIQLSAQLRRKVFYQYMLYGAAAILISIFGMALILRNIGSIPIEAGEIVGIYVATSIFGSALTALPGGFGTYEASAVFVLTKLGYSIEEALVLGFTLHLSQIVLFFFWSMIIVVRDRLGFFGLIKRISDGGDQ
jgi:uncharacterized membrane protein YbhN (UPF0104 family)